MSFSDFGSDLTDLSSSEGDLDYKPPTQKNKKKTPKAKPTKKQQAIEGALRPPRTTQYTTRSLYEQMVEGSVDLDPEYQRDVVWPDTKQIGLIDSIFRNFYIPPVIFSVIVGKDGSENRVCIDGKQRLTSLQKFMDGLIPYKDYATGKKYWYKQVGSTRGRTPLAKHLQQIFSNKQIVCMEYDGLNDDQEREMFQRVQLGVALTPAERMQAITGPWPTFIRHLRDNIDTDVFNDLSDFGKTRGRDFQAVVSVVFMIDKMPTLTTPAANALEKWLQQTSLPPRKLQDDANSTFQVLVHMVQDPKLKVPFMKPSRISPVEFVMAGLLIHKHRNELSFMQLSSAIEKMRTNVREVEKDIRTNTRVTRLLFNFIKKLKTTNLKSDGMGDKPAAISLSNSSVSARPVKVTSTSAGPSKTTAVSAGPSKSTSTTTGSSKKRKRVVESSSSDDEDADLRPPPPKSSSKTRMTMNSRAARLVDMEPPKPKWTGKPKNTASSSAANGNKASAGASSSKTVKSPVVPSKPPTPSVTKSATSAKKPAPSAVNQARNTQTARPSKPLPPPINTQIPTAPSSKSTITPRNRRQIQSPVSPPESAQSASIPSPIVPPPAAAAPFKVPKLERNPTTPTVPPEPPVFIKQEAEPISLSSLPAKPSGPSRLAALRAAKAAKVGGAQTCSPAAGSSNTGAPPAPMAAQGMPTQSPMQQTQIPMQSPAQSYQNQPATPSVLPPNLSRKPSPSRAPVSSMQSWQPPPPPSPMVGVQPTSPAYTQTPSSAVNQGFPQAGQLPQGQMVSPQTPQITMTPQNLNELLRAVGASTQSAPAFNPPNQAFSQAFNGQHQVSQQPVNGMQSGNHVGAALSPAANGSYPQFASPRYAGNSVVGHQSFGPTAPSLATNGSHSQFASPAYSAHGNHSFGPTTPSMSNGSFAPMTPAGSNGLPPRPPVAPTSDPRLLHRTSTAEGMRPPPIAMVPGSTSPGRLRRMSTETAPLPQSASPMSSFSDAHLERSDSGRYEERGRRREKYERDREWDRERDREYEHGRGYSHGRGYDYQGRSSSRGTYHHGGHYRERDRYEESSRPYDREKDLDRRSSRGGREDWYEKGKGRDERSRDSGRYGRGQTPEVERERDGVWGGRRRESGGGSGTIDEFGRSI